MARHQRSERTARNTSRRLALTTAGSRSLACCPATSSKKGMRERECDQKKKSSRKFRRSSGEDGAIMQVTEWITVTSHRQRSEAVGEQSHVLPLAKRALSLPCIDGTRGKIIRTPRAITTQRLVSSVVDGTFKNLALSSRRAGLSIAFSSPALSVRRRAALPTSKLQVAPGVVRGV